MNAHDRRAGAGHGGHSYDPNRFKLRTRKNDEQMVAFIIVIALFVTAFTVFPWLRSLRPRDGGQRPMIPGFLRSLVRQWRRLFNRSMPLLPSVGHGTLVLVYVIVNLSLAFTNTDPALTMVSNLGSRMAWMAMANMLVVIVLALKNTPLAILTPWSYERLNILHQVAGICTVLFVILHASLYTVNFTSQGRPERLLETDEIYGMVAGLSFLILGFAGVVIRRWWYEAFYYVHITFWVLGLFMTGLHQPEISKKVLYVVAAAGGIWVLDRAIRVARLAMYSANNQVTLTPLSNGATKITMKKTPFGARPGKHCFLWIPRIRPTEAHPFTIVGTNPLEFVVRSYDGFTSALHQYAKQKPGATLRASLDGPYGTFPDAMNFSKTVLVAGGAGATFTLGVAMDLARRMNPDDGKEVVFIWIVQEKTSLSWFADHLNSLQADPRFKVKLYVTRESLAQSEEKEFAPLSTISDTISNGSDPEKRIAISSDRPQVWRSRTVSSGNASTMGSELASPIDGVLAPIHSVPINFERPKLSELIETAIKDVPKEKRVLVMACGPAGMSQQVRKTTAGHIQAEGPSIELHCEQFGW